MEKVYRLIETIQKQCESVMDTAKQVDIEGCSVLEAILAIQDLAVQAEEAYRADD